MHMKKVTHTSKRKDDHLRINLEEDVSSAITSGLEKYHFVHQAIPEIALKDIDLQTEIMGKQIYAPIFISSMTGGSDETLSVNRNLALAANELNIPMGVGSQRAAIEDSAQADSFILRDIAPDIPLFANLGAVQLNYGYGIKECQQAVDMIEADALILHLNPLQEALQPEGNTDFSRLLAKISEVVSKLSVPVIVKEVGWGISSEAAARLSNAGVKYIDIAGSGGTSWSQVEKYRSESRVQAEIAALFRDWGISTAESLHDLLNAKLPISIFASGGLRTGLDAAKCIALGADLCGYAGRIIKAATISADAVIDQLNMIKKELQISMFAAGVPDIKTLRTTPIKRR
jgi:isopentenyl-diphosphate delta-isomerase